MITLITIPQLFEQAANLGQMTDNLLEARVRQVASPPNADFSYLLDIVAPALNGYYYSVLQVDHPIAPFYPLQLKDHASAETFECQNEEQFLHTLGEMLSSPQVQRVIASLLAQSTALEQAA